MSSRIPPLLEPFLRVPKADSLTLVTSVLGATANWVIIRFLVAALAGSSERVAKARDGILEDGLPRFSNNDGTAEPQTAVILVSWMRDWQFWSTEARRACGLDLPKLQQQGRIVFLDGLTELSLVQNSITTGNGANPGNTGPAASARSGPLPSRSPAVTLKATNSSVKLDDPPLTRLQVQVESAVETLQKGDPTVRILLVLDTPSLLLHTSIPAITAVQFTSTLLELRSRVHAAVVAIPADAPFLQAASDARDAAERVELDKYATTPLAADNAAFTVEMAYQAHNVISLRQLGTGWAKDVSGVVRVTRGGSWGADEQGDGGASEGEWLYYVAGDGGVRVWSRGA